MNDLEGLSYLKGAPPSALKHGNQNGNADVTAVRYATLGLVNYVMVTQQVVAVLIEKFTQNMGIPHIRVNLKLTKCGMLWCKDAQTQKHRHIRTMVVEE